MNKLYLTLKESWKEGKKVQALVGVSLFTALNIILSSYASIRIIPNVLTISFASVAVAASGLFFGPWLNAAAGIISDTLAYVLYPRLDDQRHVYRLFLRYDFLPSGKDHAASMHRRPHRRCPCGEPLA